MTEANVVQPQTANDLADARRRQVRVPAPPNAAAPIVAAAPKDAPLGRDQSKKSANPVKEASRGERLASAASDSPPPIKHFGLSLKMSRPSWSDGCDPSDPEPEDPLKKRLWVERGRYRATFDAGEAAINALLEKANQKTARHHKRVRHVQSKADRAEARKYADAMRAIRVACAVKGVSPDKLMELAATISRHGLEDLRAKMPDPK